MIGISTTIIRFGAAALACALLAGGALAQRPGRENGPERRREAPGGGGRFDRGARIAHALRTLDLTAEQFRAIRAIRDKHDPQIREHGRRILEGRRRLEEMLAAGGTPEKVRIEATGLSTAIGERATGRTLIELDVFRVLTPAQRATLRQRREVGRRDARIDGVGRRGDRWRDRHMRRPGRDAPPPADAAPPDAGDDPDTQPNVPPEPGARTAGAERRHPIEALQLTAAQRDRLRQLRRERGPAMRDLALRLRETQRAVDDALLADRIDGALVERLAGELGRLEGAREMARFELEMSLNAILTPEQAAELRESRRRWRRHE